MLKILKYLSIAVILIVFILLYALYNWHFRNKPTFLSVERKCNLIEYAKEICTDKNKNIDTECFYGRVPQESLGYIVRELIFGHKCIESDNL